MAWRDHRCVRFTCTLLLLGLLTACSSGYSPYDRLHMGDFTVGSTKNIGQLVQKGERVQGEDCFRMVFILPVSWPPMQRSFTRAIDNALEKTNGDVLVEAVLSERIFFTFVYNEACYIAEGYAARAELGAQK